ncbi:hypothetical protein [Sphingomonas sp. MMS24-J13]|uniref:hypothetical protein n=1 Tax=Sphingomonas sp. MMS24-J13 TaxID=3238686 RepID=UPI00384C4DD5
MKVLTSGRGAGTPASCHTGTPARSEFELPQRAIDRVARAAGRQQILQRRAVHAGLDRIAHALDLPRHECGIVTEIIDARRFATSAMHAIPQRDDHGRHAFEQIARDPERLAHPQRIAAIRQRQGVTDRGDDGGHRHHIPHAISCFNS